MEPTDGWSSFAAWPCRMSRYLSTIKLSVRKTKRWCSFSKQNIDLKPPTWKIEHLGSRVSNPFFKKIWVFRPDRARTWGFSGSWDQKFGCQIEQRARNGEQKKVYRKSHQTLKSISGGNMEGLPWIPASCYKFCGFKWKMRMSAKICFIWKQKNKKKQLLTRLSQILWICGNLRQFCYLKWAPRCPLSDQISPLYPALAFALTP